MQISRRPKRFFLLLGFLAIAIAAFTVSQSRAAPSGITNRQVQRLPLNELAKMLTDIATDRSIKQAQGSNGAGLSGDVIYVNFEYDYLLTKSQWKTVRKRVLRAYKDGDTQDLAGAQQLIYHIGPDSKLIETAISRLHDPDISIVNLARGVILMHSSKPTTHIDIEKLIELADSAPTPQHKKLISDCIGTIRFSQPASPSVDAQIVAIARATLEDPAATHKQRMEALISISYANGAPREAALLAAKEYLNPPSGDERMALLILTRLVSIYDNPDAESRQIATEIALPIFVQAAQSDDWSLQMSASGAARHLCEQAEPLVPALLAMLGHPDINVSMMAIDALGHIGPNAKVALPDLISRLDSISPDLQEPYKDTIYMISGQGEKPSWFDKYTDTKNKALGHTNPDP